MVIFQDESFPPGSPTPQQVISYIPRGFGKNFTFDLNFPLRWAESTFFFGEIKEQEENASIDLHHAIEKNLIVLQFNTLFSWSVSSQFQKKFPHLGKIFKCDLFKVIYLLPPFVRLVQFQ